MALPELNQTEILIRLLLAAFAGGALGFERTIKLRPAGLRTYALISVGACLVMLTGVAMGDSADPTRMAAQVVSGIGFIGVGTILTTRSSHVRGLTTAAGLWAAACLGLTIGAGLYFMALVGFVIVGMALWLADAVEDRIATRLRRIQIHLIIASPELIPVIYGFANERGASVRNVSLEGSIPGAVSISCTLKLPKKTDHAELITALQGIEGVYLVEHLPI